MPYEPELIDIKAKWTERKKQEAQRHNAQVMEDYCHQVPFYIAFPIHILIC